MPKAASALPAELLRLRLHTQRLLGTPFPSATAVVDWFGAVQAQDFAGASWALGQRTERAAATEVETAFQSGELLRTHVLRPTWHFVRPRDIRWLLALSAPRVKAASAYYLKQTGIDAATCRRSERVITRALAGGQHLTRDELARLLDASGVRLAYLLMLAELDAVICSGPRRGKQFTYALLDERVPPAASRSADNALAELARRFFTSHGPALAQDFAWWAGLRSTEARRAIALCEREFERAEYAGREYWFAASNMPLPKVTPSVHLLPNFDEYLIAYKERSDVLDAKLAPALGRAENVFSNHTIAFDGRIVGSWRRELDRRGVRVQAHLLRTLNVTQLRRLRSAASAYAKFLELPLTFSVGAD